jgi:hypothetical protein
MTNSRACPSLKKTRLGLSGNGGETFPLRHVTHTCFESRHIR